MRLPPNFHSVEHGSATPPHWLLMAPAQGLFPVFRWPLGYETLSPLPAFRRSVFLLLLPTVFWTVYIGLGFAPPAFEEGRAFFYDYAAATFVMTLLRFAQRSVGQHRGEEIHTAEAGYSLLTHLLPVSPAFTEQLLTPALIGFAGVECTQNLSVDLGWWLLVCAASYFIVANYEVRNRWSQRRAPVDDKIRAQAFAANIDDHEKLVAKPQPRKGKAVPLYGAGEVPDIAEFGGGRRRR